MTSARPQGGVALRNLATLWRFGRWTTLILAFMVAGGAFSLQLSGLDPRAPIGPDSASMRSEIALGLAFLVLAAFGASAWRRSIALLRANALLLTLPALAIVSTAWAPEPAIALRRALAFAATVLCGVSVAAYLPGWRALRFVVQAVAAMVTLSIAYVVLRPDYAIHQFTDGVQSIHAGDWRGVFVHRTALGQLAALSVAMAVYAGPVPFGHPLIRLGVLMTSVLCLILAHSGGGIASAAILLAAPVLLRMGRRATKRNWLMAAGLGAGAAILAALLLPILTPLILHALGKDATLTGRTDLWRLMAQAAGERPLFGYGYSTGFREGVAKLVASHSPYGYVPNAQNGYLDVALNLGLVGLTLALCVLGLALWRAIRCALRSGEEGLALTPLLIVIFVAEMNGVEAALISANDIFVLIYVAGLVTSGDAFGSRRAKGDRRHALCP